MFCSTEEGIRGEKAVNWRLIDETIPRSRFNEIVEERAKEIAKDSDRPESAKGIALCPLDKAPVNDAENHGYTYSTLSLKVSETHGTATIHILGPEASPPSSLNEIEAQGDRFWPLRLARELDDALLHLRTNEEEIGVLLFTSEGNLKLIADYDALLEDYSEHWLVREILLNWGRVLKRIDLTSRSLAALIAPGSCFAGTLAEIVFACDRSYMADGAFEELNLPEAVLMLTSANFGRHPMSNGLSRLETRFIGEPESLDSAKTQTGAALNATIANDIGLVSAIFDDIDWEDEIRLFIEERVSFSADAMTAMEANLRFAGPETMETRIFGRLTAWQNWVFQRPNAVGKQGALHRYGSGQKPVFNRGRV